MLEPRVLIVGFGRIGKIHAKMLDLLQVSWEAYDPPEGYTHHRLDFTHAIIATPAGQHLSAFNRLRNDLGFVGPILCEKPVVMKREYMAIFTSCNLWCGMNERFNLGFVRAKNWLRGKRIQWVNFDRYVLGEPREDADIIFDLMIHDLDLYHCLYKEHHELRSLTFYRDCNIDLYSTGCSVRTDQGHIFSASYISEIPQRTMRLQVEGYGMVMLDLVDGRMLVEETELFAPCFPCHSVLLEQINFLYGDPVVAIDAHDTAMLIEERIR